MTASKPRQSPTRGDGLAARTFSAADWMRLAIGCVAMICSTMVVAQESPLGPGVRVELNMGRSFHSPRRHEQPSPGGSLHYYGILGQVGQPGTYTSTDGRLPLAELVKAAGGVTKDAARMTKVIRHGHAGLQLVYSPDGIDQLIPGDVVVFDRLMGIQGLANSNQAGGRNVDRMVGVAFVDVYPNQPVVVSLPESIATLQQLMQALRQHPALIDTVQVIRTSPLAPRMAPGQRPVTLFEGDVVVFRPETINHAELAQTTAFPPPIPVRTALLAQATSVEEPEVATVNDSAAVPTPAPQAGPQLNATYEPTAEPEPELSVQQQTLPPLAFPEAPSFVTTTGMIEETEFAERAIQAPLPTHSNQSFVADHEDVATDGSNFATDSFDRLAMATPYADSPVRPLESTSSTPRYAVPTPFDLPEVGVTARSGSRTTTLGITVLLIAVICFAASLLWSRLDDSTGLVRKEHHDVQEASRRVAPPRRGTLDQLIDNALPIIEEQTSLPDRVEYHGDAVGRRRIRIDAHHSIAGPHFANTPHPASSLERTATAASSSGRKQSGPEKQIRIDAAGDSSTNVGTQRSQRPTTKTISQGSGLLDRVLMAMEREKRQ